MPAREFFPKDENEMLQLGALLARELTSGDTVFLSGELGAGKTTLVRGLLGALGVESGVRSPTFSLIQLYETNPPIAHVDLYRVKSHQGLGLEDLLESHLVLIEWPDRAAGLVGDAVKIHIEFAEVGRRVIVGEPS